MVCTCDGAYLWWCVLVMVCTGDGAYLWFFNQQCTSYTWDGCEPVIVCTCEFVYLWSCVPVDSCTNWMSVPVIMCTCDHVYMNSKKNNKLGSHTFSSCHSWCLPSSFYPTLSYTQSTYFGRLYGNFILYAYWFQDFDRPCTHIPSIPLLGTEE